MMDRKLKQKLDRYTVPAYSGKALEETIYRARSMEDGISSRIRAERMTMGQFFFDQCRFVRPHTWLLKVGIALIMAACLPKSLIWSETWFWTFISLAGPLLCLINANDLWGLFQPGIIEIQMTAKYSLRHVFLSRLTLFGMIDVIVIGTASAVMSFSGTGTAWQVLLYSTVPYLVMCMGCMLIFQKVREESAVFYCGAWAGLLTGGILVIQSMGWQIYDADTASVWLLAGAAALAGAVWQTVEFVKRMGGNVDEINIGTIV